MRSSLVPLSLVVCLAPSIRAADVEPFDVTLTARSNLVADAGLAFELRVSEHFAWSFVVGASLEGSDVGVNLGAGVKYFPIEDFEGFYLGFGADMSGIQDEGENTFRTLCSAFFGHKWILGPGFTLDLNAGPTLVFDEDALPGGAVISDTSAILNLQLGLGWSF